MIDLAVITPPNPVRILGRNDPIGGDFQMLRPRYEQPQLMTQRRQRWHGIVAMQDRRISVVRKAMAS